MTDFTWTQLFRYRFDNFMSRGGSSIFFSLVVVFVALLAVIFLVRLALDVVFPEAASQPGAGFFSHLYVTFLAMTDPGNMAQDMKSSPWFKVTAVMSGIAGIVLLSALIAFITTALDQKLSELKKGHSKVIESGHTLILGWSDRRILEILRELVEANESEVDPSVVILANKDKEFMDDYLKLYMPDTRNTKVITRSGEESSLVNLDIVSVSHAKSCIVLADCQDSASAERKVQSDAKVIKTMLAVQSSLSNGDDFNIVGEIFNERYRNVAEGLSHGNVTVIRSLEILSKILVQTSRSVGLSVVYNELLSFEGCEMYFYEADWDRIEFGKAAFHFPDGIPIGIRHPDGRLVINPPSSTPLETGDKILIVADDNDTIEFKQAPVAITNGWTSIPNRRYEQAIEHELIIGWSPKIKTILEEYSDYVLEGSSIDLIPPVVTETVRKTVDVLQKRIPNVKLTLLDKNANKERDLLSIEPSKYDNIIILSPNVEEGEEERADAETILQLLLFRNVFGDNHGNGLKTKLITEILDSQNMELVSMAGVHDFIISNRFISMLMAQVSEHKGIKRVYDDLFSEEGSEIYLKPAKLYFDEFPVKLSFADMISVAQLRDEICIGVKLKEQERCIDENFGVKLNPRKDSEYLLREDDAFVVVAEDET